MKMIFMYVMSVIKIFILIYQRPFLPGVKVFEFTFDIPKLDSSWIGGLSEFSSEIENLNGPNTASYFSIRW